MDQQKHLLLTVPDDWTTDQKGNFYEDFVAELLRPMRLRIEKRIRVTGMEIDLLAKGEDQPRTILVECKAYRDPLAADVISKLLGNVTIRRADAGWLFSTSDLSKDGRGQWEEIQADAELARIFTWFSPEKTIDVLIAQRSVVNPITLHHYLSNVTVGNWTLVVTPSQRAWLAQLLEDGIPTRYCVFDAHSGHPLPPPMSQVIAAQSPRFSALALFILNSPSPNHIPPQLTLPLRAPVARVISGDTWDDLRPARPVDFVGRDDAIQDIAYFVEQVRLTQTSTRTLAIQAPSGWGKSSLILKLVDHARKGRKIRRCSFTAVDTRSATNTAFVSESLRISLLDAQNRGLISNVNQLRIESLRNPLDSLDVISALNEIREAQACIVLIFDQFEELFSKEDLFETFNAVRELSLDIDSQQVPLVLGFAWKTDVSLPQQHPAYHMWHQLEDRRRSFKIRAFGGSDIKKVITKAEKSFDRRLFPVVKTRLVEQCQGLPWLLKKLLVHVMHQVETVESQYLLLERELDVELLFKEDLSVLSGEQIRCLKYVASRAPVPVADVEDNFTYEITNTLIHSHLLVRSGMNYVVYWDIFRDYLVEERVPQIPWARTLQLGPNIAIKTLQFTEEMGRVSAATLAPLLGHKERSVFNILSDLIALQLIDAAGDAHYKLPNHLDDIEPLTVAKYCQGQLRRHIVVRELTEQWEREQPMELEDWYKLFAEAHPRTSLVSEETIHVYANRFRDWLLFTGILEKRDDKLVRPLAHGRQMGVVASSRFALGAFLGSAAPDTLLRLIRRLKERGEPTQRLSLEEDGLRNAISDAVLLGAVIVSRDGYVRLAEPNLTMEEITQKLRVAVLNQTTVKLVSDAQTKGVEDATEMGQILGGALEANWKPTSAMRYANGIRRYLRWAQESHRRN